MNKFFSILLIFELFLVSGSALALDDQGLSSIMSIIDKAVDAFTVKTDEPQGSEQDI